MNRRPHRLTGWAAGVVAALAVLLTAGCGFGVQTLQPYTPADGVNFQLGGGTKATVKVRNLFIIADDQGQGFLTASMIVDEGTDTLRSVTGTALTVDGKSAGDLTITGFSPIPIGSGSLVVLTDRSPISVSSDQLTPGVGAQLVLTFDQAGTETIVVPVVSSSDPVYAGVTPSATSTPSG